MDTEQLQQIMTAMEQHLLHGIAEFWLERGIDRECGGYITNFDANGNLVDADANKYIVTQTRMIWGWSALFRAYPTRYEFLCNAKQGFDFFVKHFWDETYGGWVWSVGRTGKVVDPGKVVYGQSFAIYGLCEYYLASGDEEALRYASASFDLLQKYCADTRYGGYHENLEPDWRISPAGFAGGDRRSLDVHMHLLEAFTSLFQVTRTDLHRRKLEEICSLITDKMIDPKSGCGRNQFGLDFTSIPATSIRRTWNSERTQGECIDTPMDTTSYGHNLELSWLLNRAAQVLNGSPNRLATVMRRLVDHSLEYGFDYTYGGVYRDGLYQGPARVLDKEWWQNCEAMVGYLDAYQCFADQRYLDAFMRTWDFNNTYMIDHDLGEWRTLLNRKGEVLVGEFGNPWKAFYHTGRAVMECIERLRSLLC